MNSPLCTSTPLSRHTPPSYEKRGDRAKKRLFLKSPTVMEAMQPFVKELNFDESRDSTITLGSSPWTSNFNFTLPSLGGPTATELAMDFQEVPQHREGDVINLQPPPSFLPNANVVQGGINLPPQVQAILDENPGLTFTVLETTTTTKTYTIFPRL